jgi:hypothetical protein
MHASYLTHAQAKLDQLEEIFAKVGVYAPDQPDEMAGDKDSEFSSDNEKEEVVWLDSSYFADFTTRYNKAN